MKLSTKGRYAVLAMADLALHAGTRPARLSEISARQKLSLSYLEQLFARMRRAGLVTSMRGPGGGYRLARSAADTTISDIITAVDEPIRATACTLGVARSCTGAAGRCLTHDLWEEMGRQIHMFLRGLTLADVIERRVLGRSAPVREAAAARPAPLDRILAETV